MGGVGLESKKYGTAYLAPVQGNVCGTPQNRPYKVISAGRPPTQNVLRGVRSRNSASRKKDLRENEMRSSSLARFISLTEVTYKFRLKSSSSEILAFQAAFGQSQKSMIQPFRLEKMECYLSLKPKFLCLRRETPPIIPILRYSSLWRSCFSYSNAISFPPFLACYFRTVTLLISCI
jgi:hypothetical protein